jgi:hypothetical protein
MKHSPVHFILLLGALVLPCARGRPEDVPGLGSAAAILAVTPRTNLPPEADDPARPGNTRLLKPRIWVDDAGVDDNGNIFNRYERTAFGTWSNYDQSLANPFPLPDPLVTKDGRAVRDAATWWNRRRPEILGDFLTEVYGVIPANTPKVTWETTAVDESGGVRTRTIVGHIDNSSYPAATPEIDLTLTLPAGAAGPVPVIVMIGGGGGPRRGGGPAVTPVPAAVLAHLPAGPSPQEQILARGWGYATYRPTSVQPDNSGGLTSGIIGLMNKGAPRTSPDQWGALSAWAWGLSRTIDFLETDKGVDASRLGVEGNSRWGKTALWAAVLDPRWAIAYVSCSGEGGAKPFRRNYGETTDNIAGSHWMAAGFRRFGGHWNDIPVDSNELIALLAPRPVFVNGATQDPWSDPRGEFMAVVGAGPVYRLLGRADVGATVMPAPNVALISGDIGFREHIGFHSDLHDWPTFLEFASRYIGAPAR